MFYLDDPAAPWRSAEVTERSANRTPEGVVGMADAVGEWVSDLYGERYPRQNETDPIGPKVSSDEGRYRIVTHVLRRSMPRATEREPADDDLDESAIFGFRVLVEADDEP
jgi:hypothetical protein